MKKSKLLFFLLSICVSGMGSSVEAVRPSLLRSLAVGVTTFLEKQPSRVFSRSAGTASREWKWDEARQMYYKGANLDDISTAQRVRVPDIAGEHVIRYKLKPRSVELSEGTNKQSVKKKD